MSEDAENFMVDWAIARGYQAPHDWAQFFNAEPLRQVGSHWVQSNGLGSNVSVP